MYWAFSATAVQSDDYRLHPVNLTSIRNRFESKYSGLDKYQIAHFFPLDQA